MSESLFHWKQCQLMLSKKGRTNKTRDNSNIDKLRKIFHCLRTIQKEIIYDFS